MQRSGTQAIRTKKKQPSKPKRETRLMFMNHYAPTDACAIDHWGGDCRDVTTTKLIAVSKYPKSTVGILTQKKKRWMSTKKNYCENAKKKSHGGGGISLDVCVGGGGGRVRTDVNEELKFS